MKIDYTNLSFTQLIDKIEANRFFDLPRMVREAFRRLLTRVEALEDSPSGDSRPYKVYTALLTQTGTDAPVATVLENTLGVTITPFYAAPGQYSLVSDTPIFLNHFFSTGITNSNQSLSMFQAGSGAVGINMKVNGVLVDDVLFNHPIEIRVYN